MMTELNGKIRIIENSFLARIARIVRRTDAIAMVIGERIYLSGINREEFLNDPKWVRHEMIHIEQYRKYGILRFLILYLWESIRNGYQNNRFEVEARKGSEKADHYL